MPKSKKEKKYSFTKVRSNLFERNENTIQEVQKAVDEYEHMFVFDYSQMRSTLPMKQVRAQFRDSRFIMANNKVQGVALGRLEEDSFRQNTYKMSAFLKGFRGLFFTNRDKKEVKNFFKTYVEPDYAKMGETAAVTFIIPKGQLDYNKYPVTMEPYLRKLGLSTKVDKGFIEVVQDHVVCRIGDTISADNARLLKLWDQKVSEFRLTLIAHWQKSTGSARRILSNEEKPNTAE
eukprot:NODE_5345_length_954_cov_110.665463_g5130_i0.p1 GENE.NODE_5345_length_954_cov_110.665463_g5130_i0~~NODE_5345_length_954_cov_110.665463_g5130_i0.p1  ORF type:complete len:256 (-),score=58.61 NODE_5345_length_954_cov_110.665463_g5130_i0:186-884(-)